MSSGASVSNSSSIVPRTKRFSFEKSASTPNPAIQGASSSRVWRGRAQRWSFSSNDWMQNHFNVIPLLATRTVHCVIWYCSGALRRCRCGSRYRTDGLVFLLTRRKRGAIVVFLLYDKTPVRLLQRFQERRDWRGNQMTSPIRSVNVDHVNRLMGAVRVRGEPEMEKFLRMASDIGGYVPEPNPRHKPDGWAGASDDIERFEWCSRWLGLREPEADRCFFILAKIFS